MEEKNKATQRWSKTAVTDTGTAMLAEFAAGRILEITAAYGSISAGENLAELNELPDGRIHPLTIESVRGAEKADLGEAADEHPGFRRGYGRDAAGVLCRVPNHGRGRDVVHGGGRCGAGCVCGLRRYVRI